MGVDVPQSAGIHALAAGGMATMILAVMTRASLGHTARKLQASRPTVASYAFVSAGAFIRVLASLGVGPYGTMLEAAGVLWASAMLLFLIVYAPILWLPRLGEQG